VRQIICDRCGGEILDDNRVSNVEIAATRYPISGPSKKIQKYELCVACVSGVLKFITQYENVQGVA